MASCDAVLADLSGSGGIFRVGNSGDVRGVISLVNKDKYVAHVEPQCRAIDREFDKLSIGHDNGFLWDVVNPESSKLQAEDGVPGENAFEALQSCVGYESYLGFNTNVKPRIDVDIKEWQEKKQKKHSSLFCAAFI
ncbi:uncharacterized protein LOC114915031 isoform X2 [Cajanus cajan]|uniref:uncharacterized protein LOC114915031 isoform X2 n=1 Tax=Cajanus cajan TaxID=3821 RepID=UPI0010FB8DDA|nr:uncharacterized protein LOC114915031 isoform X2 [Cajanus cajan]